MALFNERDDVEVLAVASNTILRGVVSSGWWSAWCGM